jgi:hydrogenase nickel incorporation protein HypA/HybF
VHELGIVFSAIDTLEEVGRENSLASVSSVTLELGEVSGVVDSYLLDCWRWAADRSDLLRGSELLIKAAPAVSVCDACGRTYPTVEHGRVCPYCQSADTELLTGRQIEILEVVAT